jgi:hypothetical protein
LLQSRDGNRSEVEGSVLIASDGLHSAVRQQMYPEQPPIQWGGAIMWRGVHEGKADPHRRILCGFRDAPSSRGVLSHFSSRPALWSGGH